MVVDRIKHTKPASQRTFLDELEPIPYEITEEELASMDPRMKKILFGIEEESVEDIYGESDQDQHGDSPSVAPRRREARLTGIKKAPAGRHKKPRIKSRPRWRQRRLKEKPQQ